MFSYTPRIERTFRHYRDSNRDAELWPDFMNWLPPDLADMGYGYVYRCFDKDGVLLYIGKTDRPWKRMVLHSRKSRWYDLVDTSTWEEFKHCDLLREEAHAIKMEHPIWNIQHNRGSKK